MCRVNADVIRFIPQNIKIVFFHFYFLNQDFFLTITLSGLDKSFSNVVARRASIDPYLVARP